MDSKARKQNRVRGDIHERYDAIIVGAGVGGLTAAALLARSGKRVLLLDQHYVAGGNATLFRRKDWEFDVGLHYLGDCHPGGTLPSILDACGVTGVRFRPMDTDLEKLSFPGFDFAIPASRDEFARRLLERYPAEAKGIRRYIRFLEQCERVVEADQRGSLPERVWSIARSPMVMRYAGSPLGELLDSCTQNAELRSVLTAQHGTYGVAPKRVAAVLHAGLVNHYFRSGGYYPEGGGQHLSDALVDAIEAAGGHVRLCASVNRIEVTDGRATAVSFHNKHLGSRTVLSDTIISNADLKRTITCLVGIEHFPAKWAARTLDYEMALPLFVVFLGLAIAPKDIPYGNSNRWLFNRMDFDAQYDEMCAGKLEGEPSIYVSTSSMKDPNNATIAPEGHTNVEVMAVVPKDFGYWGITAEQVRDGSYKKQPDYIARKQELEDALLRQFERIVPGAAAATVYRESASPMTHTRYVRSSEGSCYGFAALPSQFLGKRPGARSTIEGLFFCGTNCRAGHGIVGAMTSGVQAADAILGGGLRRRVMCGKPVGTASSVPAMATS